VDQSVAISLPISAQSADEIDRLIRAAMLEKAPLRAIYDGEVRLLCPHMLGRNREGHVRILCLQIGGESVSGLQRKDGQGDWRCLALEKFSNVERAEAVRQSPGNSLRRPKCMDQIELEVTDRPEREPQKGQ
jgi:hypothetical protein